MREHDDDGATGTDADTRFRRTVASKQARKQSARSRRRPLVFWIGTYGLVGWSVAVPTVLGVVLGQRLDERAPAAFSWTITLLVVGLAAGCLVAWYWVRRESRDEHDAPRGS